MAIVHIIYLGLGIMNHSFDDIRCEVISIFRLRVSQMKKSVSWACLSKVVTCHSDVAHVDNSVTVDVSHWQSLDNEGIDTA